MNAQLKPVDDFVTDMVVAANAALSGTDPAAGACVVTGLTSWAKAGALGEMGSSNASLSVPSRVAELAFAWAEVKPMIATGPDTDAPTNASKNNLRAWAALSVARVGLTLQDKSMTDWADASVQLVACSADPDGSLPLEMARKDLALHYQLHAVTALVATAALLQQEDHALFDACDKALHRSVGFTVAAFADPDLVTQQAGEKQSYFDGSDELQGFELAWATAYLSLFDAPDLAALVEPFDDLANSKLGGQQSLLWTAVP